MLTRETGRLRGFILGSLILHAIAVALLLLISRRQGSRQRRSGITYIELDNRENPLLPRKPEKKVFPNRRIVQTEPGERTPEPEKDAYLGKRTQRVDRQTVSRSRSISIGHAPARSPPTPPPPIARHEAPAPSRTTEPRPTRPILSRLGLAVVPDAREQARRNSLYDRDEPQWANQAGEHTPQDFIQGVTESDHTALNTREYKFFGYYERIRAKLDGAWIPILRRKLKRFFFMGRRLASDMDHTTRVLVILNPRGEIIRVQVISRSGTMDLDDAAVEAFNEAGPFPNPPKGLADPNGEIRVPWEFIIHS